MNQFGYDQHGRLRSGFVIVFAIGIFFAAMLAGMLLVILLDLLGISRALAVLAGGLLRIVLTFVLNNLLFRHAFKGQRFAAVDCFGFDGKRALRLCLGLFFGIAFFLLTTIPLYLSGNYTLQWGNPGAGDVGILLLELLYFVGVGLAEELLARGAILHALLRFGKWKALLISSCVFGLLHLTNPNLDVLAMVNLILAGLIMGLSMYATGSIWVAIGFHITWNWIQGSVLGIPVSGHVQSGTLFQTAILGSNPVLTGGEFGAEASIICTAVLALGSLAFFLYGRAKGNFALFEDRPLSLVKGQAK